MEDYIIYNDKKIDRQQLKTTLDEGVLNYVNSRPWSTKKKKRFMEIYSNLASREFKGAKNDNIIVGGDLIDFNNMKNSDKELYSYAAGYIKNTLDSVPEIPKQETKETTKFTSKEFNNTFLRLISNADFGGNNIDISYWNKLDERDTKGIRGRTNRAKKLAEYLQTYSDNFDDSKYDFEDSPFKNSDDLKARLNRAILALNSNSNDVDPSLLALGLKPDDWFNTGENDYAYTDSQGNKYTYAQYNALMEQMNKQPVVKKTPKVAVPPTVRNIGYTFIGRGYNGTPITDKKDVYKYLNDLAKLPKLNGKQASEIVWAFKQAEKNNALVNLSKQELELFGSGFIKNPNHIKKLEGVEGIYWDTINKRAVKVYDKDATNPFNLLDIVNKVTPKTYVRKIPVIVPGGYGLSGFDYKRGGKITSQQLQKYRNIINKYENSKV